MRTMDRVIFFCDEIQKKKYSSMAFAYLFYSAMDENTVSNLSKVDFIFETYIY